MCTCRTDMYVHSHSPLSRGSTSRTDVPGEVRVSRAERAKPLQDDLTTTRNHTPKPSPGHCDARTGTSFAAGDEAPELSLQRCCQKELIYTTGDSAMYRLGLTTLPLHSCARTRAASRALVARGCDQARSASQPTTGAAGCCCTQCQLAQPRTAMMRRGGPRGLTPRRKLPQAQQRRLTQNR